jgi:hypothetical protein
LDLIHSITPEELDHIANRLMETTRSVCPSDVLGHHLLHTVNANGLLDVLLSYQKSIASKLIGLEQNGCSDKETVLLITSSTKIHMAIR